MSTMKQLHNAYCEQVFARLDRMPPAEKLYNRPSAQARRRSLSVTNNIWPRGRVYYRLRKLG